MYEPNDVFANRYRLESRIGLGGFSEVWKAVDQMAEESVVAIKIYSPERGMDDRGIAQFRREYAVVLDLNHPNLLTARHFDVHEGRPYLVMPFIGGGSVATLLAERGTLGEEEIAGLLAQIGGALAYLHDREILHQDLKPDNLLIGDRGDYLLTDFGISSRVRSTLRKHTASASSMTVAYAPPERFDPQPRQLPASDLFSLGVLAYELATGDVPWMGNGGMSLRAGAAVPEVGPEFSGRFRALLRAMMDRLPEARPTATEVAGAATAFLRDGSWPELTRSVEAASDVTGREPSRGRTTERMDPAAFAELTPPEVPVAPTPPPGGLGEGAPTARAGSPPPTSPGGRSRGWVPLVAVVGLVGVAFLGWSLFGGDDEPVPDDPGFSAMAEPPSGDGLEVATADAVLDPTPVLDTIDGSGDDAAQRRSEAYTFAVNRGDGHFTAGRYAEAAAAYREALQAHPGDAYATRRLREAEERIRPAPTPGPGPQPQPQPQPQPRPTLNHTGTAVAGLITLVAGYDPDPHFTFVRAGGTLANPIQGPDCTGYLNSGGPTLKLQYTAGSFSLTVSATSAEVDLTLVVRAPDGTYYCDDDSGGELDPMLTIENPRTGEYAIWVGTYSEPSGGAGSLPQARVAISELGRGPRYEGGEN